MSGWSTQPLGDLTINLDRVRVPVRSTDRKQGPYPYYGASGIVDYVDDFLFEGLHLLVAEDGENLRSRKSPIAFLANGQFWVNNHAHVLVANQENDTRFIAYALESCDISGYITGSAQPKLNQAALSSIPVSAPELDEQRGIATTLGALDDKIESNCRQRYLLRQLGGARVLSALASAPTRTATLADLTTSISRGVTPKYADSDSSAPFVINQKCIRGNSVSVELARRMIDREVVPSKKVGSGDILVNSTGTGTLGRVGRWHSGSVFADSHVSVVKADTAKIGSTVLAYLLFDRESDIEAMATGSTGQTELSPTRLGELPIEFPDIGVSPDLEDLLLAIENRAASLRDEELLLGQLRDALLPELLSGRVRVPEAELAAAGVGT